MFAITTTVKDSLETIVRFINHHRSMGTDLFFVFLDDANEDTFEHLRGEEFSDVMCFKCDDKYWGAKGRSDNLNLRQSFNANFAIEICKKLECDWIAHLDIDELIYFENNLTLSFLDSIDCSIEAISLNILEALPITDVEPQHLYDQKYFKHLPTSSDVELAKIIGNDYCEAWSGGRPGLKSKYFKGHMLSKRISRVRSWQQLSIHISNSAHVAKFSGLKVLHFDCPSVDKYINKMDLLLENFGKSFVINGRVSKEYYDITLSDASTTEKRELKEDEYNRRFTMNVKDYQLFSALGLIQEINIETAEAEGERKSSIRKFNIDTNVIKKEYLNRVDIINLAHYRKTSWFIDHLISKLPVNFKEKQLLRLGVAARLDKIKSGNLVASTRDFKELVVNLSSETDDAKKLMLLSKYFRSSSKELSLMIAIRARMISPLSSEVSEMVALMLMENKELDDAYEICVNKKLPLILFLSRNYEPNSFRAFYSTMSKSNQSLFFTRLKMTANKLTEDGKIQDALKVYELGIMIVPGGKLVKRKIAELTKLIN